MYNFVHRSTPNLRIDTELDTSLIHHEQIRTSVSSLPSMQRDNNRFSVIISTLRCSANALHKFIHVYIITL